MRIAVFHNLASGGAKRASYEAIRRLARNHSVTVFTLSSADLDFCDLRGAVDGHHIFAFNPSSLFESPFGRLNQLQRWRDLKQLLRLGKKIAHTINMEGFDVAYVHPCQFTQAPTVLKHLEIPSVYHIHEPLRRAYEPSGSRPYINCGFRETLDKVDPILALYQQESIQADRDMTSSADLLLANSQFTADCVEQIYGRASKVAYFGVDTEAFRPLSPAIRKKDYILSVGALTPYKGFDLLVKVVALIPAAKRPTLRIVCNATDERELAYLKTLAERSGVDLRVEGPISDEALLRRYNEAAILVYTPYREPFGLVPIEAMSCGTPVVAVDEGGVRETVVNGENGLLLRRETETFAGAIQMLLSDEELRHRLGRQARDCVVQNWSWEKSVSQIEDHLSSMLCLSSSKQPARMSIRLTQQAYRQA